MLSIMAKTEVTLKELESKIGLPSAHILAFYAGKEAGKKDLLELTPEQKLELYKIAPPKSELELHLRESIIESAETFEQKLKGYKKAPFKSKLEEDMGISIIESAKTLEQEFEFYEIAPFGSELEKDLRESILKKIKIV